MDGKAKPIVLRSERLAVEIAQPGTVYRGARFDWTGFVTQVTLDGRHTFCAPESLTPGRGSGGIGLCNEFGIAEPVGFDRAEPGQRSPKIGDPQPVLEAAGAAIRWRDKPDGEFYARPSGFSREPGHRWELVHLPTGMALAETDDFAPCRVALWGAAHVISPEVLIGISLAPGESMTWAREYEFFT